MIAHKCPCQPTTSQTKGLGGCKLAARSLKAKALCLQRNCVTDLIPYTVYCKQKKIVIEKNILYIINAGSMVIQLLCMRFIIESVLPACILDPSRRNTNKSLKPIL